MLQVQRYEERFGRPLRAIPSCIVRRGSGRFDL